MKTSSDVTYEATRYPVRGLSLLRNSARVPQVPMGDLKFFVLAFSAAFLTFFGFIA